MTRIFHVYGRKAHAEPLTFLGRLQGETEAELREQAAREFGEAGWVEVVAFPEESIVRVIPGSQR